MTMKTKEEIKNLSIETISKIEDALNLSILEPVFINK